MSEIEATLLEATGFAPAKDYKDRQDYLAALIVAIADLKDEDFEALPEAVAKWANDGVRALKAKKEISDFPDLTEADLGGPVDDPPEVEVVLEGVEENTPYPEPKKARKKRTVKPKLTGDINRYGRAVGSKADMVINIFEKGATMRQCKEQLGETYYNVLKKLASQGHRVEKTPEGVITLTHKDDVKN